MARGITHVSLPWLRKRFPCCGAVNQFVSDCGEDAHVPLLEVIKRCWQIGRQLWADSVLWCGLPRNLRRARDDHRWRAVERWETGQTADLDLAYRRIDYKFARLQQEAR